MIQSMSTPKYVGHPFSDTGPTTVATLAPIEESGDIGGGVVAVEDPIAVDEPPSHDVMATESVPLAEVSTAVVFPEIQVILAEETTSPTSTDYLTLSQFENTAYSGPDMNIGVSTFSQVPSFGQWENSSVQTPYKGVSIVTGQRSGTKEIPDEVPTCRNLTESFEEAEDLEVVSQLISLSKVVD